MELVPSLYTCRRGLGPRGAGRCLLQQDGPWGSQSPPRRDGLDGRGRGMQYTTPGIQYRPVQQRAAGTSSGSAAATAAEARD